MTELIWEQRFWAKVKKGPGCWRWVGANSGRTEAAGYGTFWLDGRYQRAHRLAFELVHGPIPAGLVIDHICRNHGCVNPAHLEAVTHRENILRGVGASAVHNRATHCPKGHPYDEENTRRRASGWRHCRTCDRAIIGTTKPCPQCGRQVSAAHLARHQKSIHGSVAA